MAKSTPEQTFTKLYNLANDEAAPEHERESAKRKMAAWLKRHGKTVRDYPAIFAKAAEDDKAQQPSPSPSDPRDDAPHPFDDPWFTPAGLVEGILAKYVTMSEHARVIYALWICFTHVYQRFPIAPRIALISEGPDSGKTEADEGSSAFTLRCSPPGSVASSHHNRKAEPSGLRCNLTRRRPSRSANTTTAIWRTSTWSIRIFASVSQS